jgi:hypothetical protein
MMDLPIDEKQNRVVRSFSLQPASIETVEKLAHLKHTTASKIVDTLIEHFGNRVLGQLEKGQQETQI